eukprot:125376_1
MEIQILHKISVKCKICKSPVIYQIFKKVVVHMKSNLMSSLPTKLLVHGYARIHAQSLSVNIPQEITLIFWKYLNKILLTMQFIESYYAQFGVNVKLHLLNFKKIVIAYQNKEAVLKHYTVQDQILSPSNIVPIQRLFDIIVQIINDHLIDPTKHIENVKKVIRSLIDKNAEEVRPLISGMFKVMDEIMFMQFVRKSYSSRDLETIYENKSKYDTFWKQLCVEVPRNCDLTKDIWSFPSLKWSLSTSFQELILESTNFLTQHTSIVCCGYIQKCQINCPSCIVSLISNYYQQILSDKIDNLIGNSIESIPLTKDIMSSLQFIQQSIRIHWVVIDSRPLIAQSIEGLDEWFIYRYSAHIANLFEHKMEILKFDEDLEKHMNVLLRIIVNSQATELLWHVICHIATKLSKVWSMQYVLNKMSLMEYTHKLEKYFNDKYNPHFRVCSMFEKTMISIYIQTISKKHNNDKYKSMVKQFSKCELKQVYQLFKRANKIEAKKLNYAFMNR